MTRKSDTKFGEESTCLKSDMRNLANFHQSRKFSPEHSEVSKLGP